MKNYLQILSKVFSFAIVFATMITSTTSLQAQCDTKITGSDADDYVCSESSTSYSATRTAADAGSTLFWNLVSGGTITSTTDDGTTSNVEIEWDSIPDSGPYLLVLNIDGNGCTGHDTLEVYQEKNNLTMACNDLVLVALDNNCRDTIGGDQILESPLYPDASYDVTVFNTDLTPRGEPIVNMQDLGDTLMVLVRHECSGLACMGFIAFQDNLATMLSCRADTLKVECDESIEPENNNIGFPLIQGSHIVKKDDKKYAVIIPGDCGGEFTLVYSDKIRSNNCGELYELVIERTWSAIDASGNSWSCSEIIVRKWGDFDAICAPESYDGMNGHKFFQCNDPHPLPIAKGLYWPHKDSVPGPDITGYPQYAGCSNIQFLYEDIKIPGCGYNRKILRQWTIIDACACKQKVCDQVLVFIDDTPPVNTFSTDYYEYDNTSGQCYGSAYPLPEPILIDCSDPTYEVLGYHFAHEGCDPETSHKDGLFKDSQGRFGIRNLPVDSILCISYKATDECGLYSYSNIRVKILDNEKPTAACDAHTVITLGPNARLYATALDNHSWDNCGIETLEIKRLTNKCDVPSDLLYGESVEVCCNDVGNDFFVKLRVTDSHGNYNECTGKVHVDDKEKPELTYCPPNFTIDCEDDYANAFPGGKPTATDNCGDLTITKVDREYFNDCGVGTVRRTWTIKDKSGLLTAHKCVQIITVKDDHPLTYNSIIWPKNVRVNGCWPSIDISEDVTGLPTIKNPSCKQLGIAHDDVVIKNPPTDSNACVMVLRTFTVGDWCNSNAGEITHTQTIYINDGGVPVFTNCNKDTTIIADANCSSIATISAIATDDCTPQSDLIYTYKVDLGNNGTIEKSGSGNTVTYNFSSGINKVVFEVTDACGNSATCERYIKIQDNKPPTPLCLRKLTTTLGTDGSVTIDAKYFNHGSTDNCTPNNMGTCGCETDLRFSFSKNNVNDRYKTYTCADLDNGVGQKFEVDIHVFDLAGNTDFCKVIINITDSQDVCPDAPNPTIMVKGQIVDELAQGLPGFKVRGTALNATNEDIAVTDQEGNYYLENLGAYSKYEVTPIKEDNPLDGLTTLDIVLIQKHILNIKNFNSPYKYLAADANSSNTITASDLLMLRKLILGNIENLPNKKSWKFVTSKTTNFSNPNNPWFYDKKYITDSLYFEQDSFDFVAVKIGDINRSASQYGTSSSLVSRSNTYFKTKDIAFGKSEIIPVDIKLEESSSISGFQFTLEYDSELLEIVNTESGAISLSSSNVNILKNRKGIATFSWNAANGINLNSENNLFRVNFKAKASGKLSEAIEISSEFTKAEIYSDELEISNLELRFEDQIYDAFNVSQNTPNPFSNITEINFNLPEDTDITFKILDSTGKIIKRTHRHYSKGQNSISISGTDLNEPGLYFYELTSNNSSTIKRMVYIK